MNNDYWSIVENTNNNSAYRPPIIENMHWVRLHQFNRQTDQHSLSLGCYLACVPHVMESF